MPTNAVLGFCNMVAKMLEDGDFDAGVCAYDTPAPTFRHEQFEDYKATRKPMDDSLRAQMPIVREAAEAFGFTLVELDGWEADDVIGTIARMVDEAGDEATIVTGDKDALQLVSKNVRVVLTRRGISEFDEYGRMRSGSGTALTRSTFLISRGSWGIRPTICQVCQALARRLPCAWCRRWELSRMCWRMCIPCVESGCATTCWNMLMWRSRASALPQ